MCRCAMTDCDFLIKKENIDKVLNELINSKYFTDDMKALPKEELLEELFSDNGYRPSYDNAGNIDGLCYEGRNWNDDTEFFQVFAPFVEKGSYIEMTGEEHENWRMLFDGENCFEVDAVVSWPEYDAIVNDKFTATHKIYGFSEVASEGFFNGNESLTKLFVSQKECVEAAYERYCNVWKEAEAEGLLNNEFNNDSDGFLSEEEFKLLLFSNGYTYIQLPNSHVQFEFFEQELELPERQVVNEKKPSLSTQIEQAASLVEEGKKKNEFHELTR